MMKHLEQELCAKICEVCRVKGLECSSVDRDGILIGPDSIWGLDSLDAMEIVMLVQSDYGVRIGSQETSREILRSLTSLAAYIRIHGEG